MTRQNTLDSLRPASATRSARPDIETFIDPVAYRDALEIPLLHIGYHKTGTTWLQRHLFPSQGAGFAMPVGVAALGRIICGPKGLDWDGAETLTAIKPGLSASARSGLRPVLSCENLSGNPHSGGYQSKENADRLHQLFPTARVLLVIREQRAAIASTYRQYVRIGGAAKLSDYLQPPSDARIPLFDLNHFAYHRLIRYYRETFGGDQVMVLAYERFLAAPEAFVREIAAFADVEGTADLPYEARPNPSLPVVALDVQRLLNRFSDRRRTTVNPHPLPIPIVEPAISALPRVARHLPKRFVRSRDDKLNRDIEHIVDGRFTGSNQVTASLTGLDLSALGYQI